MKPRILFATALDLPPTTGGVGKSDQQALSDGLKKVANLV